VINISTSSQISVSINKSELKNIVLPKCLALFPYFQDRVLIVGASLNGGNVLQKFVEIFTNFLNEFNDKNKLDNDEVWDKLIKMGNDLILKGENIDELECLPLLFGERFDINTFASLSNIKINNLNIASFFNSICKGLIKNLVHMMTFDFLINVVKCKRVVCTGNYNFLNFFLIIYVLI
jgi:hypothetical protein